MSEEKVQSKYIEQDPPLADSPNLEKRQNDYLAYLKEKLNFILATYGKRLTSADGHVNELIRTAAEFAVILSQKVGNDEIISSINQSPEQITISANRINLNGTTIVNGKLISSFTRVYNHNDYSQADLDKIQAYVSGTGTLTDEEIDKYDINEDGDIKMSDLIIIRNMILNSADITKTVVTTIDPSSNGQAIKIDITCTGSYNASWTSIFAGRRVSVGSIKSMSVDTQEVKAYRIDGTMAYDLTSAGIMFMDSNHQITAWYPYNGDSVIEYGTTNGGWTYRKWNSGVYECWTEREVTVTINTAWGDCYSGHVPTMAYPVTFSEMPYEIASITAGYGRAWLCGGDYRPTTTTTADYFLVRPDTATSRKYYINYYVRGTVSS